MILINPRGDNPHGEYKAIEPPIWCALMAGEGDRIVDLEVEELPEVDGEVLIVVMGNNPSVSSTPKMVEAERLLKLMPGAKVTGLHPVAVGEATYPMPRMSSLVKRRARWDLLDIGKYRAHNWHCLGDLKSRGGYASLYTSYGCPFDCSFCNVHVIYRGRKVWYREPREVVEEVGYLVREHGVKNLKLCDELFTLNRGHVEAICSGIKEYGLNIWCYGRVGMVDGGMLKVMKGAGINWIAYGFEAGSREVREGVGKRYGDVWDTVEMTKGAGINVMGNFMFGLPGEGIEDMQETLELAQDLMCEWVNFYSCMAYPGSEMYDGGNRNWESYNQYGKMVLDWGVREFRDEAFERYFSEPSYQNMIGRKFGVEAVEHIRKMLGEES